MDFDGFSLDFMDFDEFVNGFFNGLFFLMDLFMDILMDVLMDVYGFYGYVLCIFYWLFMDLWW